jgi:hypothetical protein
LLDQVIVQFAFIAGDFLDCHPERSEGSAFLEDWFYLLAKADSSLALGMTKFTMRHFRSCLQIR